MLLGCARPDWAMSLPRRNVVLGRSDIVEGKPQAGEVPDLAPPLCHDPRPHTRCPAAGNLPVVDQGPGARAGAAPSCPP